MKVNNKNIRTFIDIAHHIELEDECFKVTRLNTHAYVIKSSSKRFFSFKHKWQKSRRGRMLCKTLKTRTSNFD